MPGDILPSEIDFLNFLHVARIGEMPEFDNQTLLSLFEINFV
jgi:hypothetical protein